MKKNEEEAPLRVIYRLVMDCERDAHRQIEKKYPLPKIGTRGYSQELYNKQSLKQGEEQSKAVVKCREDIAKSYEISTDSVSSITSLGAIKNW